MEETPIAEIQHVPTTGDDGIIFIHGILSSADTFKKMISSFREDPYFNNWTLGTFEYDFYYKMEDNAAALIDLLERQFAGKPNFRLTLICHSMGGLIARMAIVLGGTRLPFLKLIVMLGTPNFGALRSAQMAILGQALFASTGKLWGMYTRQTGIRDLTKVETIMAKVYERGNIANADNVEYVTIPGTYFNNDRYDWPSGSVAPTKMFGLFQTVLGLFPGMAIKLERPHDGIVELRSVKMNNDDLKSEKHHLVFAMKNNPRSYTNVMHFTENEKLTHTMLNESDVLIRFLISLTKAGSFDTWWKLPSTRQRDWMISPL